MLNNSFKIKDRQIGEGEPCLIVAEIGLNHNGDVSLAEKLIDLAVTCGADAVKFQKRENNAVLTEDALNTPYEAWYAYGTTYGEHRRKLELSEEDFRTLQEKANELNTIFFASPWDKKSADFLERINVPAFKIASADLTNLPLLEHVAKMGKPMIISTGMSEMSEIDEAINIISEYNKNIVLLHCVSTYPSDHGEINLLVMKSLKERFKCIVGYSGHERGIAISEAAVAMGASVIERHFTLDRTMKGPDHAASLGPPGLFKLVRDIRVIETARGSAEKKIQEREKSIRMKLAKSVVSTMQIRKGDIITGEMLTTKSPGTGLSSKFIYVLPGRVAIRDIKKDSVIIAGDILVIYCIDIDGVLCVDMSGDYEKCKPLKDAIKKVNQLYDEGNYIKIFTGRGSGTGINWKTLTEKQLKAWEVKYHELIFGKPVADIFIDDKCVGTMSATPP